MVVVAQIDDHSQVFWTSCIGNVVAYRQTDGKPNLERLAVYDHGYNFRFHGKELCHHLPSCSAYPLVFT